MAASAHAPAVVPYAALEHALTREITMRGGMEKYLADLVQNCVTREVRCHRLEIEGQMTTLNARGFGAIKERLAAVEHAVAGLRGRFDAAEIGSRRWAATPSLAGAIGFGGGGARPDPYGAPGGLQGFDLLEDRIAFLEKSLGKPLDSMPVEAARQLQIMRKELYQDCVDRCSVAVERARADFRDTRLRLEELENWLRDTWVPQMVRVQMDMQELVRSGFPQRLRAEAERLELAAKRDELTHAGPPPQRRVDAEDDDIAAERDEFAPGGSPQRRRSSAEEAKSTAPRDDFRRASGTPSARSTRSARSDVVPSGEQPADEAQDQSTYGWLTGLYG